MHTNPAVEQSKIIRWPESLWNQSGRKGKGLPSIIIIIIIIINVKINVALSENALRTRYTIKI